MGLVNDLLEDFHRRRVLPDDRPESPLSNLEVSPRASFFKDGSQSRAKGNWTAAISIGLVALTCVVVTTLEITRRFEPHDETKQMNQTPAVSARPPFALLGREVDASIADTPSFEALATDPSQSVDPVKNQNWAELTGIRVESSGEDTRVRIFLSQEREYWIEGDASAGQVEVVIANTRLTHAVSPDAFSASGLRLREAHNSSIGLHLLLGLKSGSQVQSQLINAGSHPQLILDVLPSSATSSASTRVPKVDRVDGVARGTSWGSITRSQPKTADTTLQAQQSLARARNLVAQGRSTEAIPEYLRVLALEPRLHPAREALVGSLIASHQFSAAERQLGIGLDLAPSHSEYTLQKAQLWAAMKQPDRAIAILESLRLPPQRRSAALNLLAALYQQKGDYPRAETLFRGAVRIAPHKARLWLGLGIALEGQDRKTEALAVYQQAERLANFENGPRRWLRSRIRALSTLE